MTVTILPLHPQHDNAPDGPSSAMPENPEPIVQDNTSDYGDFTLDEEEIIIQLLTNAEPGEAIEEEPLEVTDIEDYEEPQGIRLPKTLGKELWLPPWRQQQQHRQQEGVVQIDNQTAVDSNSTTNSRSSRAAHSLSSR
jgi:hypothetical protein